MFLLELEPICPCNHVPIVEPRQTHWSHMSGLMPASRYLCSLAMSPFMIELMVSVRTTELQACRLCWDRRE